MSFRCILKEVTFSKNYRKNYASTLTPCGLWITTCSMPLSQGTIHAEDALIQVYRLLYGKIPEFIRNSRTVASGDFKSNVAPCMRCFKMLCAFGYRFIEIYDGQTTTILDLKLYIPSMSSGDRMLCR